VVPRLAAAARLRRTGAGPTDLRLRLLRARAREERAVAAERDALEREIGRVLAELGTSLPGLFGLGPLGAADLVVAVGDHAASARPTPSPATPEPRPFRPRPPTSAAGRRTTGSAGSGTAASTRCCT